MNQLNIVAVPFHDWKKGEAEGFRTRDLHLLQEFQRHPLVNRLLIVDRPISIAEMLILKRPWAIRGGQRIYRHKRNTLTQIDEKTFVLDIYMPQILRPLISRQLWISRAYGEKSTGRAVTEALAHLAIEEYILFLSSPLPIPLYRQLSPAILVVDAIDNLTKIAQFSKIKAEILDYYGEIQKQANVIFTNSTENKRWLSHGREEVVYVPNGVDFRHFHTTSASTPKDIQEIPHPIVGYAGKMQKMFDVEMLSATAQAYPNLSFVCIGQLLEPKWMKPLWNCKNVYYLGDKHYNLLPDYLSHFDICIIPYRLATQHGGDPIKFYEYLAMNKPVITTDIGGVSAFRNLPQVKIIHNTVEFIAAIHDHLDLLQSKDIQPAILPAEVLWSTKADTMLKTIKEKLSGNEKCSPPSPFVDPKNYS